jgi:mannose-6-phosphate isomerase
MPFLRVHSCAEAQISNELNVFLLHVQRSPAIARAMSIKLHPHQVEKPWGRTDIPSIFGSTNGRRIGEIWFEHPAARDLPLLVKYIFTSEKLSIQVHPSDEQAQARGLARGKSECWYILDADPGATLGLGLTRSVSSDELRQAAIDGSIENLMDWKPVAAGDFFFVPPGTVHAIGAGISLLEFQQNADVTYRLYDYGRPRELHLDDGIAVSRPEPYFAARSGDALVLLNGPDFSLIRASGTESIPSSLNGRRRWVMPLRGTVSAAQGRAVPGECLLVPPGADMQFSRNSIALIGCEGTI